MEVGHTFEERRLILCQFSDPITFKLWPGSFGTEIGSERQVSAVGICHILTAGVEMGPDRHLEPMNPRSIVIRYPTISHGASQPVSTIALAQLHGAGGENLLDGGDESLGRRHPEAIAQQQDRLATALYIEMEIGHRFARKTGNRVT